MTDEERCDRELEQIETLLREGHPDVAGLCLALMDWAAERRRLGGLPGSDSKAD